ncbi:hypothetical protein A3K48_05050 [candidate division WOR-1 bacterium RIFOXYA12_FULL_52_29]|uniref:NADH:quinone oxidoreductase/Mrp antiporter transmembrane domain-containing protein n=1 Tax=candidate division WOR-1 bacterium RIFOXYC12_FULL_54_18 TaxID=1802584 RepID=A0A1F4T6Y8_UNCSA|nr:MAG: hypothetical protein A3K44_05050 [candidate division WOR-1 bacterium RIFOXYA2_FULL_51_19]OGC17913.1 MAG: hypothetical protein A3K48_05050 [candidate division WOR-1 bacterium RIFOXYA12_FULL_52_29]OGC26769.1 MAG: hypothetical protein A3K32_05045 [candidate division WOR-1 bacterium RIFOXYB2_FULL_45_9]OGC28330.1 MAG: hypothetical protein A3K49_05050 [candidate division WOR-1 bacterium RIFOXYC12_FULL_54_18]OGC31214.1 MAG: hypothetical protein A2346_07570 [candidate division WOR-1 bacterium R
MQFNFLGGVFFAISVLLTILVCVYSLADGGGGRRRVEYYAYILMTLGLAAGFFFATDFILLIFYWGGLGVLLYLLIGIDAERGGEAARKTLLLVGGSDALMLCGIGLLAALTATPTIGAVKVGLTSWPAIASFFLLLIGILAKVGALPVHFWVPAAADDTPPAILAFLPASLDKLIGIYLLARLCLDVYVIVPNSIVSIILMTIGAATLMFGVLAALVQHKLKKLLSYHAISQVGYMILGVGSGIPVAVAGGIFHLINNALYKSLLFLAAGIVERRTGTDDLKKLGGLAKALPWTFSFSLIGALSISGIPPLNGFASKWLIYLGLLDLGGWGLLWLGTAMFGSALTLASFIKVIHAVFLAPGNYDRSEVAEAPWGMLLPLGVAAFICVLFGVFASFPLKLMILPAIPTISLTGLWSSETATVLIAAGLVLGLFFYWLGGVGKAVTKEPYIGGEKLSEAETRISGVEFYNTIKETEPLKEGYLIGKIFNLYELTARPATWLSGLVCCFHNGSVKNYLAWMLAGIALVAIILK